MFDRDINLVCERVCVLSERVDVNGEKKRDR